MFHELTTLSARFMVLCLYGSSAKVPAHSLPSFSILKCHGCLSTDESDVLFTLFYIFGNRTGDNLCGPASNATHLQLV